MILVGFGKRYIFYKMCWDKYDFIIVNFLVIVWGLFYNCKCYHYVLGYLRNIRRYFRNMKSIFIFL